MHTSLDSLKAEMVVAKNCLIQKNVDFDICDIKEVINKEVYPNLYVLLQVAFTIPISSVTCERSFSCMRRIKNWMRSSMTQERFTNLSLLNIEKDLTNKLKTENIINEFAREDRRFEFF